MRPEKAGRGRTDRKHHGIPGTLDYIGLPRAVAGLGAWSAAGLLAIVLHASSIALLVTPSMRRHVDGARRLGGQASAG